MIESRLSNISSNKAGLYEAKSDYEKALRDSGHSHITEYRAPEPNKRMNQHRNKVLRSYR